LTNSLVLMDVNFRSEY